MVARRLSISEFQRQLSRMAPDIARAAVKGLRSGGLVLKHYVVLGIDEARPYPAVDRGEMRSSVRYEPTVQGSSVSVDAPHAPFMEYGTRPHYPPIRPIYEWVRHKGFARGASSAGARRAGRRRGLTARAATRAAEDQAAWGIARAICAKIAEEGTAPRHFFAKAMKRARPKIQGEIAAALRELGYGRTSRRIAGGLVPGEGESGA